MRRSGLGHLKAVNSKGFQSEEFAIRVHKAPYSCAPVRKILDKKTDPFGPFDSGGVLASYLGHIKVRYYKGNTIIDHFNEFNTCA